jgi:hypothetical protein
MLYRQFEPDEGKSIYMYSHVYHIRFVDQSYPCYAAILIPHICQPLDRDPCRTTAIREAPSWG